MLLGPGKNGHSQSFHIFTFSPLVKQDICSHLPQRLRWPVSCEPSPPPVAEADGCFSAPVRLSARSVFDIANLPRIRSAPGSVRICCTTTNRRPASLLPAFLAGATTGLGGGLSPIRLIILGCPVVLVILSLTYLFSLGSIRARTRTSTFGGHAHLSSAKVSLRNICF